MSSSPFFSGEQIRVLRERSRMTQKELASKAGLARSAIARLETGRTIPNVSTLEAVASALGLNLKITLETPEASQEPPTTIEEAPPKIRVLVCDSQQMIAEAVAVALSQYPDFEVHFLRPESGLVATGLEAAHAAARLKPDVVLIDYWMSEMDGPAASRAILGWVPQAKVLLLSWIVSPSNVQDALNAGAVGFLPKTSSIRSVAEGIRHAYAGEALVYGPEVARIIEEIDARAGQAKDQWERLQALTPREIDVLRLLADGMTMNKTANRLSITPGTLRIHLQNIMAKMGAESRVEAVAMARRGGLIG